MNAVQISEQYVPASELVETSYTFVGKPVRVVMYHETEFYVANDVAAALGYDRPDNAVTRHIPNDDVVVVEVYTPAKREGRKGRYYKVKAISRSGLFSLLLHSRKQEVKAFEHWLTHDVLPQLQDTGSYTDTQGVMQGIRTEQTSLLLNGAADKYLALAEISLSNGNKLTADALISKAVNEL